jgi:hypothetical protein
MASHWLFKDIQKVEWPPEIKTILLGACGSILGAFIYSYILRLR